MKKKLSAYLLLLCLIASCLIGCGSAPAESPAKEPDVLGIKSISDLATLECYYHNVAETTKEKGTGLKSIGEKERKLWIEYDGVVKLGIDMSSVQMTVENDTVTVSLPEVIITDVDSNKDSFYSIENEDGWNKNKITSELTKETINNANEEMKQATLENETLMLTAQERAKSLIENYITQIGDAMGVDYSIVWEDISSENTDEAADNTGNDAASDASDELKIVE